MGQEEGTGGIRTRLQGTAAGAERGWEHILPPPKRERKLFLLPAQGVCLYFRIIIGSKP